MKTEAGIKKSLTRAFTVHLFLLLILGIGSGFAQPKIFFVNYGPEALPSWGDFYNRQFIHFKIPVEYKGNVYVRFFDLACGGDLDTKFGDSFSRYEVILFKSFIDENTFLYGLKNADVSTEPIILSKTISEDLEYINNWKTFAKLSESDGTVKNAYRYYSVLIKALSGNDANGFDVFLSSSDVENIQIKNAEIFSFEPTFRLSKLAPRVTFRIRTDEKEISYNLKNFDLDNLFIGYSTFLKKVTQINSSSDGDWASADFILNQYEVGKDIGISLGPNWSNSIDNDLCFSVLTSKNKKTPILYPPIEYEPENITIVKTQLIYLDDCKTVQFRADESIDPTNKPLNSKWFFEDSEVLEGLVVRKSFNSTGKFFADLLLYNLSDDITRAALIKVSGMINISPVAVAGDDKIATPDENILFDASASSDADGRIIKYNWDFGDGNFDSGVRVRHSYKKPGKYLVQLKVEDNFSESPCRFSEATLNVIVNDKPIAVTKTELIGATDETITFSAAGTKDNDGEIIEYKWDFGNLGTKFGETVTHSFSNPGTYKIKFTAKDNSVAKNNTDSKDIVVKINFPPVSRPGNDRVVAIGENVLFDGSKSFDKDENIIRYEWNFGDGQTAEGSTVYHSYSKSGTYRVTLTVTDNSTTLTKSSSAEIIVIVNEPPVAITKDKQFLVTGVAEFDASDSYDKDGFISKYLWDFGDGNKAERMRVNKNYSQLGEYAVTLKVIDNTKTLNNSAETKSFVKVNAKPIAVPISNLIVAPNQIFELSAKNSFDPDGKIVNYSWSLGDKVISNDETFYYKFEQPGLYQIGLTVQDDFLIPTYDFKSVSVLVNRSPIAVISAPSKGMINAPIIFDGGLSSDFEGEIDEYIWTFSDGTTERGKIINKTFQKSGFYEIELKVADKQIVSNSSAVTKASIFINSSPVANTSRRIKTCDKVVTFDASQSTDAEGDPLTYYWNFYDGKPIKEGVTVQHSFQEAGIYPVMLIVDDNNGLQNSRDLLQIIL